MPKYLVLIFTTLILSQAVYGQYDYDNRLKLEIAPYVWMTSMKGDLVIKGNPHAIDFSYDDFFRYSNLGLSGHVEVKKNRWAVMFEWNYIDLLKDHTYTELALGEISAGFKVHENFEIIGGGRFFRTESEFPIADDGLAKKKVTWIDPIIGGRVSWDVTRSIVFTFRSDVGGFGIGSDLQVNLMAGVGYRLANITFLGAYRIWYAKYENGSGANRFLYDITTSGPGMAMLIHF
ncbi:MAG: hypothetical protein E4H13_10375 [Calditrichales bacterium]|nr:MAG: hypothetical protein E4H13_10375 [Calditrichales bacterium]